MLRNRYLTLSMITVAGLLMAACAGSSSSSAPKISVSSFEKLPAQEAKASEVGVPFEIADGVLITVSAPSGVTLSDRATGAEQGGVVNQVEITIENTGTDSFEVFALTLQALLDQGTSPCSDVFDAGGDIVGVPFDDVEPGTSISFKFAYACSAATGTDVTLRFVLDVESQPFDVALKLT
jgi:ABC-type glycerol-3-phosphate transport system substrate-binding protein